MPKQGNGNGNGKLTLTRRDFLKASAAAGAGGGLLGLAGTMQSGMTVGPTGTAYTITRRAPTTCACCSVGCGQVAEVATVGGNPTVVDVRGDPNHVTNRGALCPKGAASVQWINGDRRLGTSDCYLKDNNGNPIDGPRYRTGNNKWEKFAGGTVADQWDRAIDKVAEKLLDARNKDSDWGTGVLPSGNDYADSASNEYRYNARTIAFLGCSHATNEENWLYRKLIANVGTNNTEHQARI